MSLTSTPPTSPFVHGTSDTTHVFLLESGTRRPIPDDVTLNFLLAGQTVRTLNDADLAAIPLGSALPSRKDGTFMIREFRLRPPPNPVYYFMTAGLRRQVPDLATIQLLQQISSATQVPLADLSAIPEGPPLPSRADNTLYRGTGSVFAYIMSAGQKRAVPNATTLRDAGHDVVSLLSLSAIDAALIPDGLPFPSTSRFLKPPSTDTPLVLLPVRLETRFKGSELWLRIYPDDLQISSFEPQLTADEQAARTAYLAQAQIGQDAARVAFGTLARQYGAARAAWIVSPDVPTGTKSAQWTIAPFSNVLPERWIVMGYQGNAAGQLLVVGPPINESLPVAPDPKENSGPLSDPGMKWVTDFTSAIQAGMAFRIPLSPEQQRGFNRIVVLGLRTGLSPQESAGRLGELFQAHHYTDGLELLALNTPTNNTENLSAGYSKKGTDYDAIFDLEQGPSLCPSRPSGDGDRLAAALNISPTILSHVRGADSGQDEIAHAINTVMWPATWGYYLSQIVAGAVRNPEVLIPAARDHFIAAVRARGHFPIMRIARQPYGVLPVCFSATWQSLEGRPLDAPLAGLLAALRPTWEVSLANVPRVPGSPDPERDLAALLGMTPSSDSFAARNVIGPEYNFSYRNFVQKDLPKTWWTTLAQKSQTDTAALSGIMVNTRLANSTYVKQSRPLTDVLIAPLPFNRSAAPGYITQIAGLGWQALRDLTPQGSPVALFFLLLRHAALRQYLDTALDLLTAAGAAQPHERFEAELLGISTIVRPTAWDLLTRTLPAPRGPVGTYLDRAKSDVTVPAFAAFWTALTQLSTYSAADLDAATREVFDLASYRLDAWITSLAYFRLTSLRSSNPNGGIVLGSYGWLENVRPQTATAAAGGFLHAPSLNQAITGAVLRAGYLAHSDATPRPFELDLSSERVRLALHLLDGIGQGQGLNALLGYRLERSLHNLNLDTFVDKLRTIAPMEANAGDLDVVDGLVLLQKFQDPKFWNNPGLPADGTPERVSLTTAITGLADALDAVADLTLSESVHHLIRGNLVRAGATLDSIARGDTPPPQIEVLDTPRSGTAITYRLMTIAGGTATGWATTPRAKAEPRLNALAASILGNPSLVRIRVQFVNSTGGDLGTLETGLDRLALAPLDLLGMPEAQGIQPDLANRIRRAVSPKAPAGTTQINVLTDRDPKWKPQVIDLPAWLMLVTAVLRLIQSARPLEPIDLVPQGDTPGAVNAAELKSRADTAESQVRAALQSLQSAPANDAALLGAAAFGVPGTVPDPDSTKWPAQIAAAAADLAGRIAQLDKLSAGFTRTSAITAQSIDFDSSRLKTIFGSSFQVLPMLTAPADIWANSAALQGNDPLESVRWFQRMSRVRPGAASLSKAAIMAEALSNRLLLQFNVTQLPAATGDKWVALPGFTSPSHLSLVAFSPVPLPASTSLAGLMLDEWTEVLPSSNQTTGVSFQYTDPVARPPQSILLAVKPNTFPEWTMEAVEGSILEALDLGRIRAVDPDSLAALGHYLPALYFAYNTGGNIVETVSTDLNNALRTTRSNA